MSAATSEGRANAPVIAFRSTTGRIWHFKGARAHVLTAMVNSPKGISQRDCMTWTIRLGAIVHALRAIGLDIATELEGPNREARYRLITDGQIGWPR